MNNNNTADLNFGLNELGAQGVSKGSFDPLAESRGRASGDPLVGSRGRASGGCVGLKVNVLPRPEKGAGQVWMYERDLKKLGGDLERENYVQVANRVYQVMCGDWVRKGTIGMQPGHWDDAYCDCAHFKRSGSDCVSATLYQVGMPTDRRLLVINLEAKVKWGQSAPIRPVVVSMLALKKLVNPFFRNHFFAYGQEVVVPFDRGTYQFKVTAMVDGKRDFLKKPVEAGNYYFGYVAKKTKFTIRSNDEDDLFIMNGKICDPEAKLTFRIISRDSASKEAFVDAAELKEALIATYLKKSIMFDDKMKVSLSNGNSFEFFLVDANHQKVIGNADHYWYVMQPNQKISLVNTTTEFTLIEGTPKEANNVSITLLSAEKLDPNGIVKAENVEFVELKSLRESFKQLKTPFILGQKQILKTNNMQVRISFEKVDGSGSRDIQSGVQQHWVLGENTTLAFDAAPKAKFALVEDPTLTDDFYNHLYFNALRFCVWRVPLHFINGPLIFKPMVKPIIA